MMVCMIKDITIWMGSRPIRIMLVIIMLIFRGGKVAVLRNLTSKVRNLKNKLKIINLWQFGDKGRKKEGKRKKVG